MTRRAWVVVLLMCEEPATDLPTNTHLNRLLVTHASPPKDLRVTKLRPLQARKGPQWCGTMCGTACRRGTSNGSGPLDAAPGARHYGRPTVGTTDGAPGEGSLDTQPDA